MQDETSNKIIFESRLHWIIFSTPLAFIIAAIIGLFLGKFLFPLVILFLAIGVGLSLMYVISYQYARFQILTRGVFLKEGIVVKRTTNIPYKSIETVDVRQNILGGILNYGTIVIRGSGGTFQVIRHIRSPLVCRRHIEALLP